MAITGNNKLAAWNQALALQVDHGNQPPAVLVRAALSLPKAMTGSEETISALLGAVEAKSPHTANHLVRVGRYAGLLAGALDLPEAHVGHLERCGLLHDVGKLGVPERVLEKPGKLTSEEWGLIQLHPVIGASVIRGCPSLTPLLPAIAMHHERWDGKGYPYGAAGSAIPLEARILSICDAFDTMTSERPYKAPMAVEEACRHLSESAGSQLDPELVPIFLEQVVQSLPGGVIRLGE
ncbi:MAG: HD-GYP domain-containing protein [Bacillota bacterium]